MKREFALLLEKLEKLNFQEEKLLVLKLIEENRSLKKKLGINKEPQVPFLLNPKNTEKDCINKINFLAQSMEENTNFNLKETL